MSESGCAHAARDIWLTSKTMNWRSCWSVSNPLLMTKVVILSALMSLKTLWLRSVSLTTDSRCSRSCNSSMRTAQRWSSLLNSSTLSKVVLVRTDSREWAESKALKQSLISSKSWQLVNYRTPRSKSSLSVYSSRASDARNFLTLWWSQKGRNFGKTERTSWTTIGSNWLNAWLERKSIGVTYLKEPTTVVAALNQAIKSPNLTRQTSWLAGWPTLRLTSLTRTYYLLFLKGRANTRMTLDPMVSDQFI